MGQLAEKAAVNDIKNAMLPNSWCELAFMMLMMAPAVRVKERLFLVAPGWQVTIYCTCIMIHYLIQTSTQPLSAHVLKEHS